MVFLIWQSRSVSFLVPFLHHATDGQPLKPYEMKVRRWVRARDPISREGGPQAHLTALAYVSDRWFIGTAWVVHMASLKASLTAESALRARPLPSSHDEDNQPTNPDSPFKNAIEKGTSEDACSPPKSARDGHSDRQTRLPQDSSPKIGMMVSLDHSIYFHRPLGFRADDWLLAEMDSPWVGDGRGFVTQRIFNKEGVLVATCVQEVRLSVICLFSEGFFYHPLLLTTWIWRGSQFSTRVLYILVLLFVSCSRGWSLVHGYLCRSTPTDSPALSS